MILEKSFLKKFENLSEDVKLSNYSWFNLGGKADYFLKAKNKNDLKEFLKEINLKKMESMLNQ